MSAVRFTLAAILAAFPAIAAAQAPLLESPPKRAIAIGAHVRDPAPPTSVRITGTASWFGPGKVALVPFELALAETKTIELPAGKWILEAEAPGYWGSPYQLDLTAGTASPVTLELWPAGLVRGRIDLPRGQDSPTALTIFFRPSKGAVQAGMLPSPDSVACPIKGRSWECPLPAGLMDLRVQAPGYVPRYLWGITIERGKTLRPEPFELYRGSAVLGWVVTAEGSPLGDQATVELRPRAGGQVRKAEEQERLEALVFRAKVNRQGFFQLDGVPPGAYVIEARGEGFAPAMASVRVVPNEVTELANPPLTLERPKVLEVFIDPPLDPAGQPWNLRLHRLDRGSFILTEVAQPQPAATDGFWKVPGIAPGHYYLRIGRETGDTWWAQPVEVSADLAPLEVRLGLIKVEGSVRLGKNPLQARVYIGEIGGRFAAVRTEVETNENGEFEAFLPKPGEWTVHVSAKDPPVERELPKVSIQPKPDSNEAAIEIRLPNTKLTGRVVDIKGNPIPRAIVNATNVGETRESFAQVRTGDDGQFAFNGLLPGPTLVDADAGEDRRAPAVMVHVADDYEPSPLVLIAEPELRLSGVVASAAGPVSGARVRVAPVGIRHMTVRTVTTDTQGRFEAFLPPMAKEVQITVAAPGFAFRMLRIAIPNSRIAPILVEPAAGTLVIESAEPVDYLDPNSPSIYVLGKGALIGLLTLQGWARMSGLPEPDPTRIVVPLVEPGEYQACWANAAERPGLDLGAAPSGPCASGYLAANGELTLKLGPPKK